MTTYILKENYMPKNLDVELDKIDSEVKELLKESKIPENFEPIPYGAVEGFPPNPKQEEKKVMRIVGYAYWDDHEDYYKKTTYKCQLIHENDNMTYIPPEAQTIWGDEFKIQEVLEERFKSPEKDCSYLIEGGGPRASVNCIQIYHILCYQGDSLKRIKFLVKKYGKIIWPKYYHDNSTVDAYIKVRDKTKPPFFWEENGYNKCLVYNLKKSQKMDLRINKGEFTSRELAHLLSAVNKSIRKHYGYQIRKCDSEWRSMAYSITAGYLPGKATYVGVTGAALQMLQGVSKVRHESFKKWIKDNKQTILGCIKHQKTILAKALAKEVNP